MHGYSSLGTAQGDVGHWVQAIISPYYSLTHLFKSQDQQGNCNISIVKQLIGFIFNTVEYLYAVAHFCDECISLFYRYRGGRGSTEFASLSVLAPVPARPLQRSVDPAVSVSIFGVLLLAFFVSLRGRTIRCFFLKNHPSTLPRFVK